MTQRAYAMTRVAGRPPRPAELIHLQRGMTQRAAAASAGMTENAAVQPALPDSGEAIRRQDFHLAQRRQATKDVKDALARGLDAGIRLQNAVRFKLGTKDEKLAEFQVKPLRKRPSPAVKRAKD